MDDKQIKLMKKLIKQYRASGINSKLSYIKARDLQITQVDGMSYYQIPANISRSVDLYMMMPNSIIVPWKYLRTKSLKDGQYSLYVPANGKEYMRIFPNDTVLYARQKRD